MVIVASLALSSMSLTHLVLPWRREGEGDLYEVCLLYTSDAADERSSVDLGGRRIIQKKKENKTVSK